MLFHVSHPNPKGTQVDADSIDECVSAVNSDSSFPPGGRYALESRDGPNGVLVRRGAVIKQKNGLSCYLEDPPVTQ
jgi:hypothetical protein